MEPSLRVNPLAPWPLLGLALAALVPGSGPQAQAVRLNGPLARERSFATLGFVASADNRRAVLLGDLVTDRLYELFLLDRAAGDKLERVNAPFVTGGSLGSTTISRTLALDTDGQRFVYAARQDSPTQNELYSTKPGATPVKISGDLPAFAGVNLFFQESALRVTPDGSTVLYLADATVDERYELFRAPVDGSAPPVCLSVPGLELYVRDFKLTPDGSLVVYRATELGTTGTRLFVAPVDGSAEAHAVDGPRLAMGTIPGFEDYALSADGLFVVFRGDIVQRGRFNLYSTNLIGPPLRERLSPIPFANGDVTRFALSADGSRAVYLADGRVDERYELFGTPIRQASATVLSGALQAEGDVSDFALAPRGDGVAFLADALVDETVELFGTSLSGIRPPVRLSPPMPPDGDVREISAFAPDGESVLYQADEVVDGHFGLYAAPLAGGAPRAVIDDLREPELRTVQTTPDGHLALYLARTGEGPVELFAAPVDGSGLPRRLCKELAPGSRVRTDYHIAADSSSVLYLADVQYVGLPELHVAELPGDSVQLTHTPLGPTVGDLLEFRVTPDGKRVVYRADQAEPGRLELFSTLTDGSSAPRRLNPPLFGDESVGVPPRAILVLNEAFQLGPDGRWVVYWLRRAGEYELFTVPSDGSLPAVALDPGVSSGTVRITPDATQVVYLGTERSSGKAVLKRVPIDGSGPPVLLRRAVHSGIYEFALAPQGDRVAFLEDAVQNGHYDLYSLPLAGGTPQLLFAPAGISDRVHRFLEGSLLFTPDGAWVLLESNSPPLFSSEYALFSVRADGSGVPVQLSAENVSHSDRNPASGSIAADVEISGSGQRAVFGTEAFSVRVDGSEPGVALSPDPSPGILGIRASPTGPEVALLELRLSGLRLWVAPEDGSRPAVDRRCLVSLAIAPQVLEFWLELTPDGENIVFIGSDLQNGLGGILTIPAAGAQPSRQIGTSYAGNPHRPFVPTPDGQQVLFASSLRELMLAPADGSTPTQALTPRLPSGRVLREITPSGTRVLFRSDAEEAGTLELWSVEVPHPRTRQR